MTRRLLLRLAFDGARFHGTQRQPDRPTVHGRLLEALAGTDLLADPPELRAHGRLDAGVSARDHPLALDVQADGETLARTLAGRAPGIVPWAAADVPDGFDPRFAARARTYRYHLPDAEGLALDRLQEAWRCFEGEHSFGEFARIDRGTRSQDPARAIISCRSFEAAGGIVLEVTGRTFLRHQVRRMVGAALTVARGEMPIERIHRALEGGSLGTYEKADPAGLVLWRVELGADWRPLREASAIARDKLRSERARLAQRLLALDAVLDPTG